MTKADEFCNLIVLDLSDLGGVKEQCVACVIKYNQNIFTFHIVANVVW